jgi:hypothetical protein
VRHLAISCVQEDPDKRPTTYAQNISIALKILSQYSGMEPAEQIKGDQPLYFFYGGPIYNFFFFFLQAIFFFFFFFLELGEPPASVRANIIRSLEKSNLLGIHSVYT